jgi:hypothetical protein
MKNNTKYWRNAGTILVVLLVSSAALNQVIRGLLSLIKFNLAAHMYCQLVEC